MTDFDKFVEFFNSFGIDFKVDELEEPCEETYCEPSIIYDKAIEIANSADYVNPGSGIGYPGFYASFYFLDGKYVGGGAWE